MTEASITQLVTFATLVVGFGWQAYREERQRRWDAEDLDRTRVLADGRAASLHVAIQDNTQKTVAVGASADRAYDEANHANIKISDLNARLLEQGQQIAREGIRTRKTDPEHERTDR